MNSLWRWWQFRKCGRLDFAVSLVAVVLFTHYAATKPTNQLENVGAPLLRGVVVGTMPAEDVERGFAPSLSRTNGTFSFSMPADAVEERRWRIRGASDDDACVSSCSWSFPVGTNSASAFRVHASGRVDAHPSAVTMAPPLASFMPLAVPLGIVPESNWPRLPVPGMESRFWHLFTPSNTLQFTWENVLFLRDAANPVSIQAELFDDGRFVYRYDLSRCGTASLPGALTNAVVGAAFHGDSWTTNAIPTNVTSTTFYPLHPPDLDDPDPDGDEISTVDEIRLHGTDPHLPDTDFDGLSDYDEIFVYETDPFDPRSLGGPGSDGLAARLAGFGPYDFPEGSTNTAYEHVFYSGSPTGAIGFPEPTENLAVLRVLVSGSGDGDLVIGDKSYPLLPPPQLRSGAGTNTLLIAVGKGIVKRLWWRRPEGLDIALDSDDFMVGSLPSLRAGWIAFPYTDANTPCIHDLDSRTVSISLINGFPDLSAIWTSSSSDVRVVNSPPASARITGKFARSGTRQVSYTVSHPDYLAGITNFTQQVRFCPQSSDDGVGEPPDETESEYQEPVPCGCNAILGKGCRCGCDLYGHEGNTMCNCGNDCACANPPEMTDDDEDAAEDEYDAAMFGELPSMEGVLHLYGDNSDAIHLDVQVGASHNCCPCWDHNRSNYVAASYCSSRINVIDASNDVFHISYSPCDVTVHGIEPSRDFKGDAVYFSTNGVLNLEAKYTILGLKIETADDRPPISVYNNLSSSFGFPVTVCTNADYAPAMALHSRLLLPSGVVRVAVENATGDVQICFAGSERYSHAAEPVLDTAVASERFFPVSHWYRLVRRHDWDLANVRVLVMASEPGPFDLVFEYAATNSGQVVHDISRQRITAVRPPLMADYNRDGQIAHADIEAYIDGRTFRYWVNECRVSGAVWEEPSLFMDIVNALVGLENWRNNHVDGAYDLINLFPIAVDFEPFLEKWGNGVSFRIAQEYGGNAFNYTFANISHLQAGSIRTSPHTDIYGNALTNAPLCSLGVGGVSISRSQAMVYETNSCLMIAEAKASGRYNLMFSVTVAGVEMYSCPLPVETSPVDYMFRFVSIRGAHEGEISSFSEVVVPYNNPDCELADKDVFFVHGFNVSASGAKDWNREMFKRFWVSGMNARYWGVTWDGDYHVLFEKFNGLHYHRDVRQALLTAPSFRNLVNQRGTNAVVIGHSLGNMVVSEALLKGANAKTYIMLDAAVASEAYRPELQADSSGIIDKYVPSDWDGYQERTWAANWYTWFTNTQNDARADLGWAGHFAPLLNRQGLDVFNFYSSGDEVFAENSSTPGITTGVFHWPTLNLDWPFFHLNLELDAFPWQKQEVFKGVNAAGSLSAGWGFHCWTTNINNETVWVRYSVAGANAMVADGSIVTNAVFDRGVSAMFNSTISDYDNADILAFHIPAVSSPAGKVATLPDKNLYFDMNVKARVNDWGREAVLVTDENGQHFETPWLHSDIKNMAYYYVYPAFTNIVEKGEMK